MRAKIQRNPLDTGEILDPEAAGFAHASVGHLETRNALVHHPAWTWILMEKLDFREAGERASRVALLLLDCCSVEPARAQTERLWL